MATCSDEAFAHLLELHRQGASQKVIRAALDQIPAPRVPYTALVLAPLLRQLRDDHTNGKAVVGQSEAARPAVTTTIGSPSKTGLRAGVGRSWYPRNSVVMTYNEDVVILDDGKLDVKTAFARQLMRSNCADAAAIDFELIVSLDSVVEAFRLKLGLAESEVLVVCIDEPARLWTHLDVCKGLGVYGAHVRCREYRAALMAYQDSCVSSKRPKIIFLWSLIEAGGRRADFKTPLSDVSEEGSRDACGLRTEQERGQKPTREVSLVGAKRSCIREGW
eukprot:Rhum_TRINITY_DN5114_c0_g1::Rhum_TRINITY_DN5114_c0_g1_i1::g.16564::m.16564